MHVVFGVHSDLILPGTKPGTMSGLEWSQA